MNALELCMYTRGLEGPRGKLFLIGEVAERERALFDAAEVTYLPDDVTVASAVLDRVRASANAPSRRKKRTTVIG